MTAFMKFLRGTLDRNGMAQQQIDAVEKETCAVWSGDRIYVAVKQSLSQREQTKRLLAAGVAGRTARRKSSGK